MKMRVTTANSPHATSAKEDLVWVPCNSLLPPFRVDQSSMVEYAQVSRNRGSPNKFDSTELAMSAEGHSAT